MTTGSAAGFPRTDVTFPVDGVMCRAWLYQPEVRAHLPAPCIVMGHGLGGTRDCGLAPYAERFAAAGFVVVVFDYRHLGDSEGEPRQVISIESQLEDWRGAVAFARALPNVDHERIGLWGTSLSGGHVIVTAARDKTIAAVSAQCPMLDGTASARMAIVDVGPMMAMRMTSAAMLDLGTMMTRQSPHYVPLIGHHGELAAMATPGAYEGCMAIAPPDWRNEIAARFFMALPLYRPMLYAKDIACPALVIACERDSVVSPEAAIELVARIGDKARLATLPIDHFDIYKGEWFERSSGEQVAFFRAAMRG